MPIRDFFVPCYLVVHPKGTLMWDVGVIPDSAFKAGGGPVTQGASTVGPPAAAAAGRARLYAGGHHVPRALALPLRSHGQRERVRRLDVARAQDRTRRDVRDAAARHDHPAGLVRALKTAKTTLLTDADYDVFGDGTVVIKYRAGPHAGPSGAVSEAEEVRSAARRGRPLSLSRRADDEPLPELRVRQGGIGEKPRGDGRLSEEDEGADVDRARHGDQRDAEEGPAVLD